MKRILHVRKSAIPILLLFFAVFVSASGAAGPGQKVVYVYDGDTILLDNGLRVRYVGINTPEIDHRGGRSEYMAEEARDRNRQLVEGARVGLEYDQERVDPHGRHLAYVFLPNGEMVNALLVGKGLACVMSIPPNLKYRDLLVSSQRDAMTRGIGIWRNMSRTPNIHIGNKRSFRFHRENCPFGKRIGAQNRLLFESRFDAFWEGYAPCKRCNP